MSSGFEGIQLAETLTHVPSRGHALWLAAWVYQLRGDAPAVLHFAERLLAICSEHGVGQYQPIGHIMHGWAFAHLVDIDEGLSELRRAPNIAGTLKTYFNAILAETELRAGNFDLAMTALSDATAICDALGETFWRAGLLCVEGDLVTARSDDDRRAAQKLYCEAIAIAREQQAKSLELRAAMSLARLWGEQGRQGEARELLAPVYGWFTEGFDTADVKDAKALLEQLT